MEYKKIALILSILTLLILSTMGVMAIEGNGSLDNPYQITDCGELQDIENLSANYILNNSVNCSEIDFEPISLFDGNFEGEGYTIFNLYINTTEDNVGLFSKINNANISNVGLINVDITGGKNIGGLVGINNNGFIKQCYTTGNIVSSQGGVGGLVGQNKGTINNSYSTCEVTGIKFNIGGLVGTNGKAGKRRVDGDIFNSYSTGIVTGSEQNESVGGLVGQYGNCYDSYWNNETSGQNSSACGEGKNTTDMKIELTFNNWNFATIWDINEINAYPYLQIKDRIAPIINESNNPSGELGRSTSSVIINITTNENATCRYSTSLDRDYVNMTGNMNNTDSMLTHNVTIFTSCGDNYKIYIRCEDLYGNKNNKAATIEFSIYRCSSSSGHSSYKPPVVVINTTNTTNITPTPVKIEPDPIEPVEDPVKVEETVIPPEEVESGLSFWWILIPGIIIVFGFIAYLIWM